MAITLPLEQMSIEDKIQAMESLWDSLCAEAEGLQSPAWHGEVLAQRAQAAQHGEDGFEYWEQVKRDLRQHTP